MARPQVQPAVQGLGVDGRNPVLACPFRDLTAVIATVQREDFCGPAAEARMQDLAWLGPRACRHEAVVEQAMRLSPILPARFATLFSSLAVLAQFLRQHYGAISRFLDKVADKEEWAVKAVLDRKKAREAIFSVAVAGQKQDLDSLPPGRRYFMEQRMLAGVDRQLGGWLTETCDDFIESLRLRAANVCRRPVLSQVTREDNMELVFNCAVLLPHNAIAKLRTQVSRANARHAQRGLIFELSGPWPPYSFSSLLGTAPAT